MILKYYNFLNESLDFKLNNPEFWEDYNTILKKLSIDSNFQPFWIFLKKWSNTLLNKNEIENAYNKLFVETHNHNKIPQRITFSENIYMYAINWYNITQFLKRKYNINIDNPIDFIKNKPVKIFRGVSKLRYENLEYLLPNKFKSFTLDIDLAFKFTQIGFAWGEFKDESKQNGFIIETEILLNDIYIYNEAGSEHECIVRGELDYKKIHIVENGKITQSSDI
jgi:hypothetical protein